MLGFHALHDSRRYTIPRCLGFSDLFYLLRDVLLCPLNLTAPIGKMSESFLVAATERASGAGTDALTALMATTGLTGGGLLDAPGFWEKESGAPLLRRNAGFFTRGGIPDALRRRLATWPALAGVSSSAAVAAGVCDDEAAFRIFLRDAERTFQDEGHRQAFIYVEDKRAQPSAIWCLEAAFGAPDLASGCPRLRPALAKSAAWATLTGRPCLRHRRSWICSSVCGRRTATTTRASATSAHSSCSSSTRTRRKPCYCS